MLSYGVSRVSKNSENLYLSGVEKFSSSTRLEERLERWLYVGDDRHIIERYVAGKVAPEPTI